MVIQRQWIFQICTRVVTMIQLGVRSKHGNQYGKHNMVSFVSTFSSLSLKTELPHSVLKEKKWVVEREGK